MAASILHSWCVRGAGRVRDAGRKCGAGATVLVLFLSVTASAQTEAQTASEAELESHARMLELLEQVRLETPRKNPYFGDRLLRRYQKMLREGDELPRKTRARLHYDIGMAQLRLGRNQEAIESLEQSHAILESFPRSAWPPFSAHLLYDLGVAHMRWGETQNCVWRNNPDSCILPIEEEGIHEDKEGSRKAIEWWRQALAVAEPGSKEALAARWLINVAAMTLGEHPDGLPPNERIDPKVFLSDVEFPRFWNVAPELGVDGFDLAGGCAIEDFDADGDLDIVVSTWDSGGQTRYFASDGAGNYDDRTDVAGLTGIVGGLNLIQADYDDDGFVDLLVLRGAWLFGDRGQHPNSLLRSVGGKRFVDTTFLAGLGGDHRPTQTGAWSDYDLDGDLDLYVGNESTFEHRYPSQLFLNEGDGTFVDVAAAAGVENNFYAKGVHWGDYDGDRHPDLFVSNLGSPNRLYHNQGDGTFENVANDLEVWKPLNSFPGWFWDYDNDGHLDLLVTATDQGAEGFTASYRIGGIVASYLDLPFPAEVTHLYRGDGKGGFVEVAEEVGLARISLPMGANFGDLDNDGFLDFYLGTGYPFYDGLVPNTMYWNRRGRAFSDVTTAGGFGHLQKGHAIAFADLDHDGDQDIFEQMGGAYPGDAFGNALFENPGFGNHWLKVRLIGVKTNRSAIGARIHVRFEENGESRSVYREVNAGGTFGCNPFTQHLGLGQAERVDLLEVFWPVTGETQTFTDLGVDQRIELVEGADEYRVVLEKRFRLGG